MGVVLALVAVAIAARVVLDTFAQLEHEVDRHNRDAGKH